MEGLIGTWIILVIFIIAIIVGILRWALRINTIVDLLKKIVFILDGKPEKAKSFMDGVRKGMK